MRRWGIFAVLFTLTTLATTSFSQSSATVVSTGVSILEGPGSGAILLEKLEPGAQVEVDDFYLDDDWTKVRYKGKYGWIKRESLRIRMDDPWRSAVWLLIGRTKKTNGFIVRFYLNTSQVIRLGDDIRFWTKVVPDNKKAYFDFMMDRQPNQNAEDFRFNSELWEGNCSSGKMKVLRSLLYWRSNKVTAPQIATEDDRTSSNSAARVILEEACVAARR